MQPPRADLGRSGMSLGVANRHVAHRSARPGRAHASSGGSSAWRSTAPSPGCPSGKRRKLNGEAQVALAQARHEGGDAAFERYYVAFGRLRHDQRQEMSSELVRKAAVDADMHGLVERALAQPELPEEIVAGYDGARASDVFGVPTLQLMPSGSPIYGPILPLAPRGERSAGVVVTRPVRARASGDVRTEALAPRSSPGSGSATADG